MNTRTTGIILAIFLLSGCGAMPTVTPVYLPTLMPMPTHSPLPITETSTVVPILTPPTENVALSPTNTQPIISTETVTLTQQDSTASPQTITCQVPQGWVMYTVQRNDTLSSLSQSTGTSVVQIQAANCLFDTLIFAGQSLYLPFIPPLPTIDIAGTSFSTVPAPTNTKFPTPPPPAPPPPGRGGDTLTVIPDNEPP